MIGCAGAFSLASFSSCAFLAASVIFLKFSKNEPSLLKLFFAELPNGDGGSTTAALAADVEAFDEPLAFFLRTRDSNQYTTHNSYNDINSDTYELDAFSAAFSFFDGGLLAATWAATTCRASSAVRCFSRISSFLRAMISS